jgi:hypothetical protein
LRLVIFLMLLQFHIMDAGLAREEECNRS